MFRLYRSHDLTRQLSPGDFQYILTPEGSLKEACIHYDLSYEANGQSLSFGLPKKIYSVFPYKRPYERKSRGYADPIYDEVEQELQIGWLVGVDTSRRWSSDRNPFYIDDNGDLMFTSTASSWHAWYKDEIMSAYRHVIADRQGRKPAPTQRIHYDYYGPTTARSGKTLNSKTVGRLLAAGGVYNGNIEGFHETAQQLGGDAPASYDQVMNNKGLIITGASVAAGLTMGRLNPLSEIDEISGLSKIPTFESPYVKGFISESGTLVNAEHAIIDPKKLATYALDSTHPAGGHKARVFESALGYNPTNADVLTARIQEGVLSVPAKVLQANNYGQTMAVDMPILGVNGETAIVRTGWMYKTDALVPRLTTLFVK
ncbi:hypothetical protein IM297_04210 [Enterobacter cloacae complex sp. I1]|uniref:DUF6883 domain-containing protein n=1 Tax=unclassified Enterobacter cloacae complex TaxID=2757714 RepID=UPI0018681865|nr:MULTISPECIES: DUF6883 domain-containing protein [unclassified Enterobacter cloacae complex]MBE3463205.1 hypothetical protein [Enterobacter cloacae complex sp. P20C]MBE3472044.1 hypothetical protein [Enterobacter cloacae complex sp. P20B]MBE3493652.1 hypothetical protein [Enterobacter cloacae complex sp. P17RS]MBE3509504.1 hypothetical protein [Enterobacter cloacae complex sp. I10]MBE3528106.1 hypothetical protein [Enterobacter cloacae complex sp. I9]